MRQKQEQLTTKVEHESPKFLYWQSACSIVVTKSPEKRKKKAPNGLVHCSRKPSDVKKMTAMKNASVNELRRSSVTLRPRNSPPDAFSRAYL
jgi:hypothetical protein